MKEKRILLLGSRARFCFSFFPTGKLAGPAIITEGTPVSYTHLLFAHSRHIVFPPVLVYGLGAICGKITAIEPLKISRSISDRVDYCLLYTSRCV